jgi:hypothetical protein
VSSADHPNPDARKRAEQLERSREWLKRYHEQRKAKAIAAPIEEAAE